MSVVKTAINWKTTHAKTVKAAREYLNRISAVQTNSGHLITDAMAERLIGAAYALQHTHHPKQPGKEMGWQFCVTPAECAANPKRQAAHGSITRHDMCRCGMVRLVEINEGKRNYGAWQPAASHDDSGHSLLFMTPGYNPVWESGADYVKKTLRAFEVFIDAHIKRQHDKAKGTE